jgi:hypothetical protein
MLLGCKPASDRRVSVSHPQSCKCHPSRQLVGEVFKGVVGGLKGGAQWWCVGINKGGSCSKKKIKGDVFGMLHGI